MNNKKIKFGVGLYGYALDYYTGKYTLRDCLVKAKEAKAEGIEIVTTHMVKGHPYPSEEWLTGFKDMCEEIGVEPYCYSTHIDRGRRSDRRLNDDELIQSTINDLRYAALMGASAIRTQQSLQPKLIPVLLPWAEKYNVKIGVELHPPHKVDTPVWLDFWEEFRKADSPYVGTILDFGIYQEFPHDDWYTVYRHNGLSDDLIKEVADAHRQGIKREEVLKSLEGKKNSEIAIEMTNEMYDWYVKFNPDGLKEIMPYCVHMHTKFFKIENGNEKTIPYEKLLKIITDSSFKGYFVSEFEGHFVNETLDSADEIRKHIEMEKRILGY